MFVIFVFVIIIDKNKTFLGVNKMELCIECHKEKILIKSRKLCLKCAARFYKTRQGKSPLSGYRQNKVENRAEVEFIKNYFTHNNWIFHPGCFRLNDVLYHPDFYDGERNIFIEVSGTQSAFYVNRAKYNEFLKMFPKINFEVRTEKGTVIPISIENMGTYPNNERKGK